MSWHTKEDVIDDLTEVMGNGMNDFDEQYILRGEQPPPPVCTLNEMDDEQLYSRTGGKLGDKTMSENCRGPDLLGIKAMLQMVDEFNSSSNTESNKLSTQSSTGITITKLGVNVPEFVPKNGIYKENSKSYKLSSKQTLETNIKDVSDKLKSKIEISSKTNNLKMKQERNLAIASLLKLHSKENSIAEEAIPKLITLETFQKNSSAKAKEKSSQGSSKKQMAIRPLVCAENVESTEEANSMNHELEESVAKVNNWLNKGREKDSPSRSPALYLGPVKFRKKVIKNAKSSNSDVSDKSIKSMMDKPFIPSEYADKLTQHYEYIVSVNANVEKSQTIWSKLHKDLKVKDKEILSKLPLSSE